MPRDPRNEWHRRREDWRRPGYERHAKRPGRYPTGADWDRYQTGREQRYAPEWEGRRQPAGFEGDRSYEAGGYAEEVGYRRDAPGYPEEADAYEDFERMGWVHDAEGDEYFGTGTHYGSGFGTAPGTRASGAGVRGAPGYAAHGAWSDRYSDWMTESGGGRGTSGGFESYGRSLHGAQPGYGRDYGQSYASQRGDERYGRGIEGPGKQSFRGRGPKGYTRSDARLEELICERLTDDPEIDASDIEVDVDKQLVRLSGTVEDRLMKYAAEELAMRCGAKDVDNQLRVQRRA